jgi:hypothetical protein
MKPDWWLNPQTRNMYTVSICEGPWPMGHARKILPCTGNQNAEGISNSSNEDHGIGGTQLWICSLLAVGCAGAAQVTGDNTAAKELLLRSFTNIVTRYRANHKRVETPWEKLLELILPVFIHKAWALSHTHSKTCMRTIKVVIICYHLGYYMLVEC